MRKTILKIDSSGWDSGNGTFSRIFRGSQKHWTRLFQLLEEEKQIVKKLTKAKTEEEKQEFSRQLAIPIKESLNLLEENSEHSQ